MSRIRLSNIALNRVGGLEEGLIVVAIANVEGLTKGRQYVLHRADKILVPIYYTINDNGQVCSDMKFFVKLEDWREFKIKGLGL